MKTNEELINQMKLDHLRSKLAEGERDLIEDRYTELQPEQLSDHFQLIKNRAIDRINQDKKTLC
ncbi:MAG TPA: hypothetical protein VIF37_05840 [Methylobacter sp.]